ncbi:MAG: hypothetical protein JWO86_994 [Myxococcaceae bacterium]|nr:hypothetical protein [Myxococcaceae bacterium]
MKLTSSLGSAFVLVLVGCGAPAAPIATPTTTTAAPASAPAPIETAAEVPAPVEAAPAAPVAEAVAEKCGEGWVCVKINFATRKVEKRETKLMGDPKIESTWSKMSDGRPATFDDFSKGPVELTLRRKSSDKSEVVVKAKGGGEIVIDRHDGTIQDFTHIGAIATEQDGALLIDMRYMR